MRLITVNACTYVVNRGSSVNNFTYFTRTEKVLFPFSLSSNCRCLCRGLRHRWRHLRSRWGSPCRPPLVGRLPEKSSKFVKKTVFSSSPHDQVQRTSWTRWFAVKPRRIPRDHCIFPPNQLSYFMFHHSCWYMDNLARKWAIIVTSESIISFLQLILNLGVFLKSHETNQLRC